MAKRSGPRDSGEYFAQIAVKNMLLTQAQSEECLKKQKEMAEAGQEQDLETIAVSLGYLSKAQAALVTRAKNYLRARREDLLLSKVIIKNRLANETDVKYALTLQDALYQNSEDEVPRLTELLQEDDAINPRLVEPLHKILENIRQALANGAETISDDPDEEYEIPESITAGVDLTGQQQTTEDIGDQEESDLASALNALEESFGGPDAVAQQETIELPEKDEKEQETPEAEAEATEPGATVEEETEEAGGGAGEREPGQKEEPVIKSNFAYSHSNLGRRVVRPAPMRDAPAPPEDSDKGPVKPDEEELRKVLEKDGGSQPRKIVRAHPRFHVKDATVHFAGDGLFSSLDLLEKPCHIVNLSLGGICILARRALAVGEKIKMAMHIPCLDTDIEARGEVRSCKTVDKHSQRFQVGVKFLKLTPNDRKLIARLANDPVLREKGKFRRYSSPD